MKRCLIILLGIFLASTASAVEPFNFDFGGPRKATATILSNEEFYEIEVGLREVQCFDSSMNRRLSQAKARAVAQASMIRCLGGGSGDSLEMGALEVVKVATVDGRLTAVFRVPSERVRLIAGGGKAKRRTPMASLENRSILQAADDHRESLKGVAQAAMEELPAFKGNMDSFRRAVSDAEEIGVTRFDALDREVATDRWLLNHERDEISRAIVAARSRFLDQLKKRYEEVEPVGEGKD